MPIIDRLSRPDSDLSVPALARRCAMSVRTSSRAFHRETGTTPAAFVQASRVQTARRLIETSDATFEDIAHTETVGNEMQQPARSWLGMLGRRWPTALGLAVAASSAYELVGGTTAEGVEQALIIALPVLVYLTAAVLDRPRSAWPVTVATGVLVFGMSAFDIEPVLGLAAASGVVLVVGIVRRLWRGAGMPDTRQLVGALGFGTAAVLALYVARRWAASSSASASSATPSGTRGRGRRGPDRELRDALPDLKRAAGPAQ